MIVIKGQYYLPFEENPLNINVILCIPDMHYILPIKKQSLILFFEK